MKIHTKIGFILSPLLFLLLLALVLPYKIFAAGQPTPIYVSADTLFTKNNPSFTLEGDKIIVKVTDPGAAGPGASPVGHTYTLTFTDSVNDSTYNYLSDTTQSTDNILFCKSEVDKTVTPAEITFKTKPSGNSAVGQLKAFTLSAPQDATCSKYAASGGDITVDIKSLTPPPPSTPTFDTIKYSTTGNTYTQITPTSRLYGINNSTSGNSCYGGSVILVDSSGKQGIVYSNLVLSPAVGTPLSNSLSVQNKNDFGSLLNNCLFISGVSTAGDTVNIANSVATSTAPATPPATTTAQGTDVACYSSGWALSWLACPVITTAQTAANAMYGFVEDQLKFTVLQKCTPTPSNPTPNCADSLGQQHDSVHSAWNNFRILVSGLVVILLLVMVISQAIGSGPFDAYTVRKMLPRLVMGVILIQISWPLFSWIVNTVDHLGVGLADIMYAPFGGSDALNLNTIMKPFTGGTAEAFNWIGFFGVAIGTVVAPFLMLGIILSVLVAIFAAFLTLLFRKIIIILALIFVPVALISWMMPNDGLRQYWKLWWSNFSKALMMFPLIIAIIAGGRIFAKIGSAQSDFVGFFIVLVGFFGPLFILPKTFKWGGTLMQSAGSAISSAGQKGFKKPKEFLGERQKTYSAEKALQSQERYSRNQRWNWRRPSSYWQRPVDLFKSGQYDPTLMMPGARRMRQRAMTQYFEKGEKSRQEDISAAEAKLIPERQRHRAAGGQHDVYLQAIASGLESFVDPNTGQRVHLGRRTQAERMAAMKQLAKLGAGMNWRYLENYFEKARAAGGNEAAEMRKFFDDNVDLIISKLPHIYKSIGQAADANPTAIAQMHGVEVEAILANLTKTIQEGAAPNATVDQQRLGTAAQSSLITFLQNYQKAATNDQLSGDLENGGLRAIKAFLDSNQTNIDRFINVDGGIHGRVPDQRRRDTVPGEVRPNEPTRVIPALQRSDALDPILIPARQQQLQAIRIALSPIIDEEGSII